MGVPWTLSLTCSFTWMSKGIKSENVLIFVLGNLWESFCSNITFLKEHNDEINSKLELQSNKDNLQKSILFL